MQADDFSPDGLGLATMASYHDGGVSAAAYRGSDGSMTVQMVTPPDEATKAAMRSVVAKIPSCTGHRSEQGYFSGRPAQRQQYSNVGLSTATGRLTAYPWYVPQG